MGCSGCQRQLSARNLSGPFISKLVRGKGMRHAYELYFGFKFIGVCRITIAVIKFFTSILRLSM